MTLEKFQLCQIIQTTYRECQYRDNINMGKDVNPHVLGDKVILNEENFYQIEVCL